MTLLEVNTTKSDEDRKFLRLSFGANYDTFKQTLMPEVVEAARRCDKWARVAIEGEHPCPPLLFWEAHCWNYVNETGKKVGWSIAERVTKLFLDNFQEEKGLPNPILAEEDLHTIDDVKNFCRHFRWYFCGKKKY